MNATAEDLLALLVEGRVTPGYAAGELDKGQPYISRLLSELVDEGYVTKIDRGLYEITPEGEREVHAEEDEPDAEENHVEPTSADGGPAVVEDTGGDTLDDMVAALELEGHGTTLENRERAVVAVVERLREEGAVSAGELKEVLDGFDHGYGDADGAWSNLRRQNVFDDLPVETPGRGGKLYRYQE